MVIASGCIGKYSVQFTLIDGYQFSLVKQIYRTQIRYPSTSITDRNKEKQDKQGKQEEAEDQDSEGEEGEEDEEF